MTELMDIRNGIKHITHYTKDVNGGRLYIYVGVCNDEPTKWITTSEWNYKMRIVFDKDRDEIVYIDDQNQEILIFEKDEVGWYKY